MIRAVLFDFHGVLVDDEPIHGETLRRVLEEEGVALPAEDRQTRLLGLGDGDERDVFAAALVAAGQEAPVPRLMRLAARKASYYQERIRAGGYPFFAGARELVAALTASGRMLGVVSSAPREEVEDALRQEGLLPRFKVLVTAEDVGEGKPHPEGYRRACEGLNSLPPLPERLLHPHEVLAIEASPAGLAGAAGAGLLTLGVAHTYPAERLGAADRVIDRLDGLDAPGIERLCAEISRR